jgi:hypothetical protein
LIDKSLLAGEDDEDVSSFFGKAPLGGTPRPINPGFGMTGQSYRQMHPGDMRGRAPFGPNNDRKSGSRALAVIPKGLLAGPESEEATRTIPDNFIADVDIDRNWFSPFQPVTPFGPPYITTPREWDYPVGINIEYWPAQLQKFGMLRALAGSWGILATIIEARIDEIISLPWAFKLKDEGGDSDNDPRIKQLNDFFKKPDRKRPYAIWMRMLFRDRYEIDAATCFIRRNALEGEPYALEALDGGTIKPLVDDEGRIPDFPQPAYQQIIKGLPFNNFTERDLLYMPNRPRTNLPIFGYPEVEQVMLEATEGIRKTLYQLNFWQEGTIPDVMLGVPDTWTPEQIAMWQASFDALLAGNAELKSKVRFIPGGMKPFELKGSAGELLKCDYDEWITRIICFAFRMDPKPFVKDPEPKANAEQLAQTMRAQGLNAEMTWWSNFINQIIELGWGWTDIEHRFDQNEEVAATDQATIDAGDMKVGALTVNERRMRNGLEPVQGGDVPLIYIATGAVPLDRIASGELLDNQKQQVDAQTVTANKPTPKPNAAVSGKGRTEKAASGSPFVSRNLKRKWQGY